MDETEQFRKDREEKYGGEIRFMTYATFIGEAGAGKKLNRGGILFVIKDQIYFEDFERQNTLMSLMGVKEKYSKTEMNVSLENVSVIKEIKEKNASDCILGLVNENEILPLSNNLLNLFSNRAIQIQRNDSPSLFFDFLEREGLINLVNEYMLRPE